VGGTRSKQSALVSDDEVCFAGAFEQARLVRDRVVSAEELVCSMLRQIERVDRHVNAFRVVFADTAITTARRIDAAAQADDSKPLLGVPVAIKDDCDVAGEVTAWGTKAYGPGPSEDAEVVHRLRTAGAIILGKTHVPEMTAWPWTSSDTWGVTRNPWNLTRTAGGSSGGSAAAVASGMCGMALGSDGGGSIRYPAGLVGVFGLKPQLDRIPLGRRSGAWNGLLALGPLTRTVRDAALFLDATAATSMLPGLDQPAQNLRVNVSFDPPRGSFVRLHPEARRAVEMTAELLIDLGHRVSAREVDYGNVMNDATIRYLDGVARDVAAISHPERLHVTTRRLARVGRLLPRRIVERAVGRKDMLARRVNRVFDDADFVLTPMSPGDPPAADAATHHGLLWALRHSNVAAWAIPWNAIGQPAVSLPVGFDSNGLPLAVQLCAPSGHEHVLLDVASQIEAARPWTHWRPPFTDHLFTGA
jgi:amidase